MEAGSAQESSFTGKLMRSWMLLLFAYGLVASLSLWLRAAIPVYAIANAAHDDFLFVLQAYYLGGGQWLGPFKNLTLVKGPAYPAFILAAFVAHLPLKLAEQALYLGIAGLTAWLAHRITKSRWLPFCLFAWLAFNPVLWTANFARVIRDGLYVSLPLAVIALAALAFLPRLNEARSTGARVLLWIGVGVSIAIFWLTREEGLWLAPSLAILLAWVMLNHGMKLRSDGTKVFLRRVFGTAVGCAVAGLAFAAVVGSVAAVNRNVYGVFVTNEFREPSFLAAYGALSRIQPDAWQRYIVVPRDVREKAYAVSSAARELRLPLEGEIGESWRLIGCQHTGLDSCKDIQSSWFVWALRDAVAAAGHYSSAPDAFAFYRRLAAEIDAACDDGRLACLPPRATMAPPFRLHYATDALALVPTALQRLIHLGDGNVGAPPSVGPQFNIDLFADLVGGVTRSDVPAISMVGTLWTEEKRPQIIVRDESSSSFAMNVDVRPDEEETPAAGPAHGKVWAFELGTDCLRPTCVVVVSSEAGERKIPVSNLVQGQNGPAGELSMTIRRIFLRGGAAGVPVASAILRRLQLRIAHAVATVYAIGNPWLVVLAFAGLLAALVGRPRDSGRADLMMIALVCATGVAARIGLLAYVDATSIPGTIDLAYLSPASPLLLVFTALGLYLGIRAARQAVASNRGREAIAVRGEPSHPEPVS